MKKTLRGAAMAIAENFSADVAHVRDCEYQPGHWKVRLYTPFHDGEYYTATSGKAPPPPGRLSTRVEGDTWDGASWCDVTQDWFAKTFNNRVFQLVPQQSGDGLN